MFFIKTVLCKLKNASDFGNSLNSIKWYILELLFCDCDTSVYSTLNFIEIVSFHEYLYFMHHFYLKVSDRRDVILIQQFQVNAEGNSKKLH